MIAYLIGFRGAGKTTLGREVVRRLPGWSFLDLDEEFEKREGTSISAFVDAQGTERFRRREAELLREIDEQLGPHRLVATGGGVVDWGPSRELLAKSHGAKIFLDAPAEALWARLEKEPERRKIGGLTDITAMRGLLEKRLTHYEKIATYRVENRDITQALTELGRLLRSL